MNNRYIDFVPAKAVKNKPTLGRAMAGATAVRSAVPGVPKRAAVGGGVPVTPRTAAVRGSVSVVPKRVVAGGGVSAAPSSAVKSTMSAVSTAPKKSGVGAKVVTGSNRVASVPKPAFVNVEKVSKRPLSKNVYRRDVAAAPKEAPSGPVRIIDKPENDSKVGLIITIVITIILGAAAGTVAFLLLPK